MPIIFHAERPTGIKYPRTTSEWYGVVITVTEEGSVQTIAQPLLFIRELESMLKMWCAENCAGDFQFCSDEILFRNVEDASLLHITFSEKTEMQAHVSKPRQGPPGVLPTVAIPFTFIAYATGPFGECMTEYRQQTSRFIGFNSTLVSVGGGGSTYFSRPASPSDYTWIEIAKIAPAFA